MNLWVWNHRTSLSTSLFIKMSVPSQESEWSCICVLGNNHFLIWGGAAGIFIVLVNFFSEPSSVKRFFSHEKESKKMLFLSCGTEIHVSITTIHRLFKFSSAIFFFLAGDSINFFSATMQNLIFFRSARALNNLF